MQLRTTPRIPGLAVAVALLIWPFAGRPAGAQEEPSTANPPPTIVLMISDDQHYGDFGFAGNAAARTPNLDRLAGEGALFPVAHVAMSRCRPSLAALLTGTYPHQNGVYYNFADRRLAASLDTLPRQLRREGYACWMGGKYWEGDPRRQGFSDKGSGSDVLVRQNQEAVRSFLEATEGVPVFLWWAPMLPHLPHDPPERLVRAIDPGAIPRPEGVTDEMWERWKSKQRTLLAMGAWLDEGVGELLEILAEHGRLDRTLIVFLADNGYDPLLPAKGSAYERGFRTPLILWEPDRIREGRIDGRLVSALDVVPTLLEWAGAEPVPGAEGASLWPLLEDESARWRDRLFGASYPRTAATPGSPRSEEDVQALYVRTERWKYIVYVQEVRAKTERGGPYFAGAPGPEVFPAGHEQLFDLQSDPGELENLAARPEHEARIAEFRRQVFDWWNSTGGGELEIEPGDLPLNPEGGGESS